MSELQLITNSSAGKYRACQRLYYIDAEVGLRSEVVDVRVRVGTGFHAAVDADAKGEDPEVALAQHLTDPYDLAMVMAMFEGHQWRWADHHLEFVASELQFRMPLRNPETGAASTTWQLAGVIDRIVRLADGRLALMEYKTTNRDFARGQDYWLALHLDPQLSIYVMAARELGYDVSTVLYDVTRRPGQRPCGVPVIEDGAKVVLGPDGARVRTKDGKKWRETGDTSLGYVLQTRPETPAEYAARITEAIAADPIHYYDRIEIARLDQDLEECAADLWRTQKGIRANQLEAERLEARGRPAHAAWARNPSACLGRGFTCQFLQLCQTGRVVARGLPAPEGFVAVADPHPELAAHATADA